VVLLGDRREKSAAGCRGLLGQDDGAEWARYANSSTNLQGPSAHRLSLPLLPHPWPSTCSRVACCLARVYARAISISSTSNLQCHLTSSAAFTLTASDVPHAWLYCSLGGSAPNHHAASPPALRATFLYINSITASPPCTSSLYIAPLPPFVAVSALTLVLSLRSCARPNCVHSWPVLRLLTPPIFCSHAAMPQPQLCSHARHCFLGPPVPAPPISVPALLCRAHARPALQRLGPLTSVPSAPIRHRVPARAVPAQRPRSRVHTSTPPEPPPRRLVPARLRTCSGARACPRRALTPNACTVRARAPYIPAQLHVRRQHLI
jgi:hypothetical protein